MTEDYRTEHDSMGEVRVPADALWRAQTQRAVENFPISGTPLEPRLVRALALVKQASRAAGKPWPRRSSWLRRRASTIPES